MNNRFYISKINQYIKNYGSSLSFKYLTIEDLEKNVVVLDECVDFLLELLCQIGLQKNYEPNEVGLEIENCLDFLNRIRYKYYELQRGWDPD